MSRCEARGEISLGRKLTVPIKRINSDGSIAEEELFFSVGRKIRGGFHGDVIFPEFGEFVIKTTVPSSNLKKFLRYANWDFREFPSQTNEVAAQLDFLATNLINEALPISTEGRFYSPRAYGYTRLASGNAHILEKVYGRGPIYQEGRDDYDDFTKARRDLREWGYRWGVEHVAQIDEENLWGLPNIWRDDSNNRWVWVDVHPAFKHKPTLGVIRFKFHQKEKDWFYCPLTHPNAVTYNKIHTGFFLQELYKIKERFEPEHFAQLKKNLYLYTNLRDSFERDYEPGRDYFGAAKAAVLAVGEVGRDVVKGVAAKVIDEARSCVDFAHQDRMIFDPIEKAHENGQITSEDLEMAKKDFFENGSGIRKMGQRIKAVGLAFSYFWLSRGVNLAEYSIYTNLGLSFNINSPEDLVPFLQAVGVFTGARFTSPLIRSPLTFLVGLIPGVDLRTAAPISIMPFIGENLAWIAQLNADSRGKNRLVAHFVVRDQITTLSKLHPAGGENTDVEAKLWEFLGSRMEKWAERK